MSAKKKCFGLKCTECGMKLGFLKGYRHPVEGWLKCVCGTCWNKIDESEKQYSSFIHNAVNIDKVGVVCFLMIDTKPKYDNIVCNNLSKLPEVLELYSISGEHDIIAKIEIEDYEKLGSFVINKVRTIEGIRNTKTLTGAFSLTGSLF